MGRAAAVGLLDEHFASRYGVAGDIDLDGDGSGHEEQVLAGEVSKRDLGRCHDTPRR
jgi:hypothetical protein